MLNLGRGDGWFTRWVVEQSAAAVLPLVAPNMLGRARELTSDTGRSSCVEYCQVNMRNPTLAGGAFKLVFKRTALSNPRDHVMQELYHPLGA